MPKDFSEFRDEVVQVWTHGLYGVDIGTIVTALAILLGFLIFRGFLSRIILYNLHLWVEKTSTKVDDSMIEALIPPIRFIPVVLGIFFAGKYLGLSGDLAVFFTNVIRSLIAFTIFWGLHRAANPLRKMFRNLDRILSKAMVNWIFKALKVVIFLIGMAVILEIWGIRIAPVLAGFGLLGVAVALGAQDLFKNLIAGLTVIAEKRFSPGDLIVVEGVVDGAVEDIGFRSTRIRRPDLAPMHVPNAQLADSVVINNSRRPFRRIQWLITITDAASLKQIKIIRDGILNFILTRQDIFATPAEAATLVRLDSIGDHSLDITVTCFARSTGGDAFMAAKEELAFAIKDIVENKAGVSFASPSQNLYVKSWPGAPEADRPECFKAPKAKKPLAAQKK